MRTCHDSNDTLLARCWVAHFENTRAKGYIHFSPKSWISLSHRKNMTISNISVNWFNEDMPRFQWHLARPMMSCPHREHSRQRLHTFQPEIMNHLLHRINVTISNTSVNWFNEDMPRFQWHPARPMLSCPPREHSRQMLHKFQPEIMNHPVTPDKYDNFKYKC